MTLVRIDHHLNDNDRHRTLAADVRHGLSARPKQLPPKYFYDDRGSALFEEITRLPEYYQTRAERSILAEHAEHIAKAADADTLVELGSGSSEKTRLLLDGMLATGDLRRYVPVDVSAGALTAAVDALHAVYPALEIHGVVADMEHQLDLLPTSGARLVAFLGGTIGNLTPPQRHAFLVTLGATLRRDDFLLLGVDLVKDPARLIAAYDDSAGVTAEFNRNVLHVLNRELDADFQHDSFAHLAVWDAANEWIEMRLRARRGHRVHLARLGQAERGLDIEFMSGEEVRTEISAKFRREGVESELMAARFEPVAWWTDVAGDYAVALARWAGPSWPPAGEVP